MKKKAESLLESVPLRLKKKVRKHSRIKAKIRRKKMKWRKRIWCTEHKCMGKTMYNTCRIYPWIRCNIQTDMSTWNKEERKNGSEIFYPLCRWRVFSKEECPVRCGVGMRRQLVHCIKQTGYSQAEIIRDRECRRYHGAKPDEFVPCTGKCLPTYWSYTEWSKVCQISLAGFWWWLPVFCELWQKHSGMTEMYGYYV